jgi:ATP synthase mitochondrial F1 complex assembly factor 2
MSTAPSIHDPITGRQRFYKAVSIQLVPASNRPMYRILLDGKVLRTPGRNDLHLPSVQLAAAIACEWDMQNNKKGIQPATMPLMSLAATAIDQVISCY